eukprot:gene25990-5245_t
MSLGLGSSIFSILGGAKHKKSALKRRASVTDFSVAEGSSAARAALQQFEGNVVLVVNVACKCGFTGQYDALEELQQKYKARGFSVIAFPCNQFGKQEPWEHERIAKFAQENYNVTFPIYEKINVNGAQTDPLYKMLKEELPGMLGSTSVKWNFTKFLCGRDGVPFKRYSSLVSPSKISSDIERLLKVDVGGATPILSPNARVVDEGDATEGDEACTLPQRTASN